MSDTGADAEVFSASFPLWTIVDSAKFTSDPTAAVSRFTRTALQRMFVPIFTDEDLAVTFAKRAFGPKANQWSMFAIMNREVIHAMLTDLKAAGFHDVGLDPSLRPDRDLLCRFCTIEEFLGDVMRRPTGTRDPDAAPD